MGYDGYTGHGRLDAYKALQLLKRPQHRIEHFEKKLDKNNDLNLTKVADNQRIKVKEYYGSLKKNRSYKADVHKMTVNFKVDFPSPDNGDPYYIADITNSPYLSGNGWWPLNTKSPLWGWDATNKEVHPHSGMEFTGSTDYYLTYENGKYKINVELTGYFFHCHRDDEWYPFRPTEDTKVGFSMFFTKDWNLGTSQASSYDGIKVFPNPAMSVISFESTKGDYLEEIRLFDMHGKQVKLVLANESKVQINIDDLPKGVYIANLIHSNESSTKKIIKQ